MSEEAKPTDLPLATVGVVVLIGVPTSLYLVYYFIVYILRRKRRSSELK